MDAKEEKMKRKRKGFLGVDDTVFVCLSAKNTYGVLDRVQQSTHRRRKVRVCMSSSGRVSLPSLLSHSHDPPPQDSFVPSLGVGVSSVPPFPK